jgi:hypothetical protein
MVHSNSKYRSREPMRQIFKYAAAIAENVVKFYNGGCTAGQSIKEGKNAVKWTKLSCRTFKNNQTRL